jgi:hypothetical protein
VKIPTVRNSEQNFVRRRVSVGDPSVIKVFDGKVLTRRQNIMLAFFNFLEVAIISLSLAILLLLTYSQQK